MNVCFTVIIILLSLYHFAATQYVPDSPIIKSISCNKTVALITWEARDDNEEPTKGYYIQYNTSFSPYTWQELYHYQDDMSSSNCSYIAFLPPGIKQSFRIIAWNKIGSSRPSDATKICETPPDVPYKNPDNVYIESTKPHNLVVHWTPMPQIEHHAPKFQYRVFWRKEGKPFNVRHILDWKQSSTVIENQPSYQQYYIKVLAINEMGAATVSANSITGYSGENKPLRAPTNFTLVEIVSSTTVLVAWDSVPTDSVRGRLMGYKVKTWAANENHHVILVPASLQTVLLTNLIPFTNNFVQVFAYNRKFDGPPSETLTITMPEDVPGSMSLLTVEPLGTTTLRVKWYGPEFPNGIITGYRISYAKINETQVGDENTISINNPNQKETKLAGLEPDTVYRVFGSVLTKVGESPQYFTDSRTGIEDPRFKWKFITVGTIPAVEISWTPNFDRSPGSYFAITYKKDYDYLYSEKKVENVKNYIVIDNLELNHFYDFQITVVEGSFITWSARRKVYVGYRSAISERYL